MGTTSLLEEHTFFFSHLFYHVDVSQAVQQKNVTFKQVKDLHVVREPGQDVGEVLLVQLQVVWNVGYFIGDVIRKLVCAQVGGRGAPDGRMNTPSITSWTH